MRGCGNIAGLSNRGGGAGRILPNRPQSLHQYINRTVVLLLCDEYMVASGSFLAHSFYERYNGGFIAVDTRRNESNHVDEQPLRPGVGGWNEARERNGRLCGCGNIAGLSNRGGDAGRILPNRPQSLHQYIDRAVVLLLCNQYLVAFGSFLAHAFYK